MRHRLNHGTLTTQIVVRRNLGVPTDYHKDTHHLRKVTILHRSTLGRNQALEILDPSTTSHRTTNCTATTHRTRPMEHHLGQLIQVHATPSTFTEHPPCLGTRTEVCVHRTMLATHITPDLRRILLLVQERNTILLPRLPRKPWATMPRWRLHEDHRFQVVVSKLMLVKA